MRIKFNMTEIFTFLKFQHLLKNILISWNLKEVWNMEWESHMEWDGTWNSLIADCKMIHSTASQLVHTRVYWAPV